MSNTFANYPAKYLLFNSQTSKNLAIVMEIEGVPTLYGIADTFTQVRYGDPDLVYGLPGLVYGGLRKVGGIKSYMMLDGSMTIGQKIEPESGKGNIGTLSITLIDKNGEISLLIAPGIVVDEILFKRQVRIWLGFTQTSYPEDYLIIYQGYFTSVDTPPGVVRFQISDTMSKVRQPIANTLTTKLSTLIDNVQTNIPVFNSDGFYQQILGPDGTYDPLVETFIRVEDEVMSYGPAGLGGTFVTVIRGVLGSLAIAHDIDTQVSNSIQVGGITGINIIEFILKILLSGWNGPCETNIPVNTFVFIDGTPPAFTFNAFTINQNALIDLGLSVGDYFTISGATNLGNDVTGKITGFGDRLSLANSVILTDQTFTLENPTMAVIAFRSQFDTLPIPFGLQMRMRDVDVQTILYIKNTYFNVPETSNVRLYVDAPIQGLDLISTELCLPFGLYNISRFGRVSLSITKPPLPGVGKLVQLDWTNILDADKIHVTRSTNNRSFYNFISYEFDYEPVSGTYGKIDYFLDTNSLNQFGGQVSQLPIQSKALHSDIGGAIIAQGRGKALLTRYKTCTLIIELTVNWTVGSLIEVSDVVLINDNGQLQIMNFETGIRNLGAQLFEVIDRQYNIMSGTVKLKVMGGLGFNVNSRFALFAPSSQVTSGSTSTSIKLTPSYGQTNIINEIAKWTPLIGLPVQVHSYDWSVVGQATLVAAGDTDPTALTLFPALGFTPSAGYIVDIAPYPSDTNKLTDALLKTLFTHWNPTLAITSGVDDFNFHVSLGDAALMAVGGTILVRAINYSSQSPEVIVQSIVGTLVTTVKTLGFTPSSSDVVESGFLDGLGYYRWG